MKTEDLTITDCANSGCNWACCSFQKKSHIILLPGELESVPAEQRQHLEIIEEDYHGGAKAHCHAKDTAGCDGGYKPMQCGIYPLWVKGTKPGAEVMYRSNKCPLPDKVVQDTVDDVLRKLTSYRLGHDMRRDDLDNFLGAVWIDNYREFPKP